MLVLVGLFDELGFIAPKTVLRVSVGLEGFTTISTGNFPEFGFFIHYIQGTGTFPSHLPFKGLFEGFFVKFFI